MGAFFRFLIGAEALRHLPTPKKVNHLVRRLQIALIAVITLAVMGVITCALLIAYLIVALSGGLPR